MSDSDSLNKNNVLIVRNKIIQKLQLRLSFQHYITVDSTRNLQLVKHISQIIKIMMVF